MGLRDRVARRAAELSTGGEVSRSLTLPPAVELNRGDPVSMQEFGYLVAGQAGRSNVTGVTVSPERMMGVAAWWRGVRYLTESVALLPWHTYRDRAGQRERRASPRWMIAPSTDISWSGIVEAAMLSMIHRGNFFAQKVRDPLTAQVIALLPIHPDLVKFGVDRAGRKWYLIRTDGGEVPASSFEVFHIAGLSSGGVFGLDVLRYAATSMAPVIAADEYAAKFYNGSTNLTGYITMPGALADAEVERVKRQWSRFHSGLGGHSEFGVLADGATYNTVSVDPEGAQMLESRNFGVVEVARVLGIPPHKLYELSRATFSNIEHQAIEAVVDSVRPWVLRIERAVRDDPHLMPPGSFIEASLEGLLRGDSAARAGYYSRGILDGWLAPAEARDLENLPAMPGTRYLNVPLNMRQTGPDAPAPDVTTDVDKLAVVLQKLYLAVGKVITADEARAIANEAGAGLVGSLPAPTVAPSPAPGNDDGGG